MTTLLMRYVRLVRPAKLADLLADPSSMPSEEVGGVADLSGVRAVFEGLVAGDAGQTGRAAWDAEMVEPLHRALSTLPHRTAADMRFWHWMCVAEMSDVVLHRWYGGTDVSPEVLTRRSLFERFLGSSTLRGVSRNALARLWWCGEALHSETDGYDLAREVLARQDLFQNIFERRFGLYPPAARACLRRFRDATEEEWRSGTRRLNHYLTTVVVEALTEDEILELLT